MFSAYEKFEFGVVLCFVDYAGEFLEACFVDDGADEVLKVCGFADFEGGNFLDEFLFEFWEDGFGHVGAGTGAAFLALVFEGAADSLNGCIGDVGVFVDEMEVLAACFAYDAWVALVFALGDATGNLAIERAEYCCTAGVVEGGKLAVGEDRLGDLFCISRNPLDDVWWETGFDEDLVEQPVRGDG